MIEIEEFINENYKRGQIPRLSDILEFANRIKLKASRSEIVKLVRLNPLYQSNLHQEREKRRSGKQRPILANSLGSLHADLGFFSVVREYETPKTFRYGYFVAKDVLSRFIYVELMKGPKSADNMIKVLKRLLENHKLHHPDYKIQSISFDKEPAMMSKKVQSFLKQEGIQFFYFEFSSSKAKVAENGIKLLRTDVQRMLNFDPSLRWWNILQAAADNLNRKEIIIRGKKTGFRPIDIGVGNVQEFVNKIYKQVPGYYFTQFTLPHQMFHFKFDVGEIVRPKLITTSSQVIGLKTSQVNLESTRFKIESRIPFITTDFSIRKAYKCRNITTTDTQIFNEEDLALAHDGKIF